MGKTNSFKVGDKTWLYNQTSSSGYATPYLYARVDLPIGDKKVHTRSTRTTDRREAAKIAHAFYLELVLHERGLGPAPVGHLRQPERQKPEQRFDHLADAYADWLEQNAGQDQRKLWGVRNTKQVLYAVNGLTNFWARIMLKTSPPKECGNMRAFRSNIAGAASWPPAPRRKRL